MTFLYGIKNCNACANRKECNEKNDPSTLQSTPKEFDHTNRGLKRHGAIIIKIESYCIKFKPEGKME